MINVSNNNIYLIATLVTLLRLVRVRIVVGEKGLPGVYVVLPLEQLVYNFEATLTFPKQYCLLPIKLLNQKIPAVMQQNRTSMRTHRWS